MCDLASGKGVERGKIKGVLTYGIWFGISDKNLCLSFLFRLVVDWPSGVEISFDIS